MDEKTGQPLASEFNLKTNHWAQNPSRLGWQSVKELSSRDKDFRMHGEALAREPVSGMVWIYGGNRVFKDERDRKSGG